MKNDFICPKCRGHLNIKGNVIFSVKNENGDSGLILLSPELGNYSIVKHDSLLLKKGENLKIFCPACHHDLVTKVGNKNLAKILMIDDDRIELSILFSGIFGEQSTYQFKGEELDKTYGQNAKSLLNFENLSLFK